MVIVRKRKRKHKEHPPLLFDTSLFFLHLSFEGVYSPSLAQRSQTLVKHVFPIGGQPAVYFRTSPEGGWPWIESGWDSIQPSTNDTSRQLAANSSLTQPSISFHPSYKPPRYYQLSPKQTGLFLLDLYIDNALPDTFYRVLLLDLSPTKSSHKKTKTDIHKK